MDELVRIRYVGTEQVRELPKRNAAGLVSRRRAVYAPIEDEPKAKAPKRTRRPKAEAPAPVLEEDPKEATVESEVSAPTLEEGQEGAELENKPALYLE